MSLKIANLRLELDEPEEALPEKLAERLGRRPRGDRPLADPPQEPRRPPARRPPLRLRGRGRAPRRRGRPRRVAARARRRAVRARAVRLARAGLATARAPAGDRRRGAGRAVRRLPARARAGYRPLILERGRAVKDRVADVRRFDAGGPLDPESNYLFGEGGAGTFSDGKLTSRGTGPDVRRVLEILADCHGKPSIVYEHRPHLGSNRLPLVVRTLRRKLEELGGEVRFSCRVEDLDIADGRLRGPARPARATSRPTSPSWPSATAPATPTGCSCAGACRSRPSRSSSASGSSSRRSRSTRPGTGPFADHPALGAADYNLVGPRRRRDLFTFCMCAGGYVMPSVSEPGYFCTNGMSESRHDSPFANSGLVVTIDPDDTGSRHPLAGVHFQQRAERLAYLAGGRSYAAPIQWARDFLAGRPSRGKLPSQLRRGARSPIDLGADPAAGRRSRPSSAACRSWTGRFGGLFLQRRHADRPRVARQLAGPHPPRRPRPARARPSPASTPAARGPATPAGSSARPSTASGRPGRSSPGTRRRPAD